MEESNKNVSLELVWQSVDWIYLDQKRDGCRAVIDAVMNLEV
jgi:hypothetical protein